VRIVDAERPVRIAEPPTQSGLLRFEPGDFAARLPESGDLEQAADHLPAAGETPDDADAFRSAGPFAGPGDRTTGASPESGGQEELDPDDYRVRLGLARHFRDEGVFDAALRHYARLIERHPEADAEVAADLELLRALYPANKWIEALLVRVRQNLSRDRADEN
jgi:hypothetical protein